MIAAQAPPLTGRLIDPFVGGGSVLLATPPEVPAWANDACSDLILLYRSAGSASPSLRDALESDAQAWSGFSVLEDLYAELAATFTSGDGHEVDRLFASHRSALVGLIESAGPGLLSP